MASVWYGVGVDDLAYLKPPAKLVSIGARTSEIQFSMGSEILVGALLRALAVSKPKGQFLELGTGTGIATAWLLSGMNFESSLVSVDSDPVAQQVAREALGEDQRLTLVNCCAMEFLRKQAAETFDLVFADAMPGKYQGLADALAVVKPGGFYVIDDMLPQPNWPDGHQAKVPVLLDKLAGNRNFQIIPLVWSSGVVIAVRTRSEIRT
jgi:predicted O-methyltransferase YrrM